MSFRDPDCSKPLHHVGAELRGRILELLGVEEQDLLNLYIHGSRVFGTATKVE